LLGRVADPARELGREARRDRVDARRFVRELRHIGAAIGTAAELVAFGGATRDSRVDRRPVPQRQPDGARRNAEPRAPAGNFRHPGSERPVGHERHDAVALQGEDRGAAGIVGRCHMDAVPRPQLRVELEERAWP
jgi:hypothetical protein